MNNQECEIRSEITEINSNGPTLYRYSVITNKWNKCSGSYNNINDPYAKSLLNHEKVINHVMLENI